MVDKTDEGYDFEAEDPLIPLNIRRKAVRARAVALRHERHASAPPVITAMGQGHLAERILSLAYAQGIPVREDSDLVEILSKMDIDSPVPTEAFAAIAEILAALYALNGTPDPFHSTPENARNGEPSFETEDAKA